MRLRVLAASSLLLSLLPLTAQGPSAFADTAPTGISANLWQAYQDIAIIDPGSFPYQDDLKAANAVTNILGQTTLQGIDAFEGTPLNEKWYGQPNIYITGGATPADVANAKAFVASIDSVCTDMAPVYSTLTYTTTTVASHGRVRTVTTANPSFNLVNLDFLPSTTFQKVITYTPTTATKSYGAFTYDTAGFLDKVQGLFAVDGLTQSARNLLVDRMILQAMGLFGTTTTPGANAFSSTAASSGSWDGTLSALDKEVIALHCTSAVPSFKPASVISVAISNYVSSIPAVNQVPNDSPLVKISTTELSASFQIAMPSVSGKITQGITGVNYSITDSKGKVISSGLLDGKSELFQTSWQVSVPALTRFASYSFKAYAVNARGNGPTTSTTFTVWG